MSEFQSEGRSDVCRDLLCGYFGTEAGPYYQRVYDACASLYRAPDPKTGITYDNLFSLTEIWRRMGNAGEPTEEQLMRVYKALDAMRTIIIKITDSAGRLIIDGYLLNLEFRGYRTRRGYIADGVDIVQPPPLAGYSGKACQVKIDQTGDVFNALVGLAKEECER